jgi:hypothetical protein
MLPEQHPMDAGNAMLEVPDLLWLSGNGKNWTKNHKGVVIISTDTESEAVYSTVTNQTVFSKV